MFGIKKLRKEFQDLEARYNQSADYLFGCKNELMDDVRKNQKDILALKKEKEDEDREEAKKVAETIFNDVRDDLGLMNSQCPTDIITFTVDKVLNAYSKSCVKFNGKDAEFWFQVEKEIEERKLMNFGRNYDQPKICKL